MAQAQWEQQRSQHYVLDANWRDGFGEIHRVRIEVRDQVPVTGTDRATGQPLSPIELASAATFVSLDTLFATIAAASRPPIGWRDRLVWALPALGPWISSCVRPRPEVRYDPVLGYPASLVLRPNPCTATFVYSADLTIRMQIERLLPLP